MQSYLIFLYTNNVTPDAVNQMLKKNFDWKL